MRGEDRGSTEGGKRGRGRGELLNRRERRGVEVPWEGGSWWVCLGVKRLAFFGSGLLSAANPGRPRWLWQRG